MGMKKDTNEVNQDSGKTDSNANSDSGNQGEQNKAADESQSSGDFDLTKQPKEVQDMIKALRTENAKHRTEKNALSSDMEKIKSGLKSIFSDDESDKLTPEQKIESLSQRSESLEMQNAMLSLAIEHGIGKDDLEYFEFTMSKKLNSLEENQELSEEDFGEIISGVKARSTGSKGTANSSAGTGKKPDQNAGSDDSVTLEQFTRMGPYDRSKLYRQSPDLYNRLMGESKNKKLF